MARFFVVRVIDVDILGFMAIKWVYILKNEIYISNKCGKQSFA